VYPTLFRALMNLPILQSVLRPLSRLVVGLVAVPVFRFLLRRVFRLQELDAELEKDLEQWFRGSLLLLVATANMEHVLFGSWIPLDLDGRHAWVGVGLRLLLAIGVVEAMPDQELFAVIHPGPPPIKPRRGVLRELSRKKWLIIKGVVCQYLNRSSPVFAIMAAIFGARIDAAWIADMQQQSNQFADVFSRAHEKWIVGWACYGIAIFQYLVIGLVTSRDKALNVLAEFDRAVAHRRRELVEEFDVESTRSLPNAAGADAAAQVGTGEENSGDDPVANASGTARQDRE